MHLQFLVSEYNRIIKKVPELFFSLMDIHIEKVERAISPGFTLIRWTSLNLDEYISNAGSALSLLELLVDRLLNMHENRIMIPLKEIEGIPLFQISDAAAMRPSEVYEITSNLCEAATVVIETKSQVVERAVMELIKLLTGPDPDVVEEVPTTSQYLDEPGALSVKRKVDHRNKMLVEAENLQHHYEQVLVEAQYRLIRSALEIIRKRLAVRLVTYGEQLKDKPDCPLFVAELILVVPDIIMKPTLDEIQQWLNKTVSAITSTTKGVYRWGQARHTVPTKPEGEPTITLHVRPGMRSRFHSSIKEEPDEQQPSLRTFYRPVSEHKEIQKLVAALSLAINSTKRVSTSTIKAFSRYNHLWRVDRERRIKEFIEMQNPGVNEFRVEMSDYTQLTEMINAESDMLTAGAVLLNMDQLKLALNTEARAWVVCYGRAMNHKYQTVMEEVFKSIGDWTKRLNRPLGDLDDIRSIMATLKEIREKEIGIDMSLDPIEVRLYLSEGKKLKSLSYYRVLRVISHLFSHSCRRATT